MRVPTDHCAFRVSLVFLVTGMLPLAGCIAHAPASHGNTGKTSISVSPTSVSVSGGNTQNFTATVTGPQVTAVTWNVNGIQNGNSTIGTMAQGPCGDSSCAIYTAPPTVPNPNTVSITAVSAADGTTSKSATVTITPSQVVVNVSPSSTTLQTGQTTSFTATVTGATDVGVGWYVNGVLNGNANVGTITSQSTSTGSTATYTAPDPVNAPTSNPSIITIAAKPHANTFIETDVTVTILPIVVSLSPVSVTVPVETTQTYTASVTGTGDTSATRWQVNNILGGNSTVGTIASNGPNTAVYTAPSTVSAAPFPVTITAVSSADRNSSGTVQADVQVVVSISPATDAIGQGANLQYSATVMGAPSNSQGVQWSVTSGGGAFDDPLNNAGLYIAPQLAAGQTSLAATVKATSTFDQSASAVGTLTVQQTDPLGTVFDIQTLSSCPADSNGGLANGTCYSMTVACDGIADITSYMKVNTPPVRVTPKGTVIFLIGSGGDGLYDNNPLWQFGYQTVESVNATFNTVQISFGQPFTTSQSNGWLQGPGGVRRLACRYATLADWVFNNPKMINASSTSTTSTPMCGTGNSGGSAALSYAAFEYGLAGINTTGPPQEFSMIEPSSGPVMTRLDWGCVCNNAQNGPADSCSGSIQSSMCYSQSEAAIIDPAYQAAGQSNQPSLCSQGLSGSDSKQAIRFLSDSINYSPSKSPAIPLSKALKVLMRFGGLDVSTAVPQGMTWWGAVGPTPTAPSCTQDAQHDIPDITEGATDIANDIIANCK